MTTITRSAITALAIVGLFLVGGKVYASTLYDTKTLPGLACSTLADMEVTGEGGVTALRAFTFSQPGYLSEANIYISPGCGGQTTDALLELWNGTTLVDTFTFTPVGSGNGSSTNQAFVDNVTSYTWKLKNTIGNHNTIPYFTTTTVPYLPLLGITVTGANQQEITTQQIQNRYPVNLSNVQGDIRFEGTYTLKNADVGATYDVTAHWYRQGQTTSTSASTTVPYFAENVVAYVTSTGYAWTLGVPYDWYMTIDKNGTPIATSSPTTFYVTTSTEPIPPVVPEPATATLPYENVATSTLMEGKCTWAPGNWFNCALNLAHEIIVPHDWSTDTFKSAFTYFKGTFPFVLFYQYEESAQTAIASASSSQTNYDLNINVPPIGNIPILTSSTLEQGMGSTTKDRIFNAINTVLYIGTGITALAIIAL